MAGVAEQLRVVHDVGSEGFPPTDIDAVTVTREADTLRERLSETEAALAQARHDLEVWRSAAVARWAGSLADVPLTGGGQLATLRRQVDEIHRSASWRVTRPLRLAGRAFRAVREVQRRR